MSRRIEIELTSARPDGSWTWRVAGAKQPKGVLDGSILPGGAKVGDVFRADADVELEGTVITTILGAPPKRQEPERLQLLGDQKPFEAVTTNLAPKGSRPKRDWAEVRPRSDRPAGPGGRAGAGGRPGGPGGRPGAGTTRPGPPPGRPEREQSRSEPDGRPERTDRPARPGRGPDAPARSARAAGETPGSRGGGRDRASSTRRPAGAEGRAREAGPSRPKRLNIGNAHRDAVLESLAPEERPVAEQLLQGGIPAVRRAVQDRNTQARTEGRPEVKADALLALAEDLLPRLKSAEWRDRADAAAKDLDDVHLRDLRSIVAGADAAARDDDSRILAKTLREALERRETAERDTWIAEVTTCLDDGKVTRALRLAGRPPDPRTRIPPEMTTRLAEAASAAMAPETSSERWSALLAAVLESPVRRAVKPAGLPASPPETLVTAARQASGRIPALAAMLGLHMPPPPGPPRPGMRPPKPPGRLAAGSEEPRPDATGSEEPRPDATGSEEPRPDATGSERPGANEAGPQRPRPDPAGSAIAEQSPSEPAPASAQPGTPLDPATTPDTGPPEHPGPPDDAGAVVLPRDEIPAEPISVSHNAVAPPTPGGGTDDQPTPQVSAQTDPEAAAAEPEADPEPV